MGRGRLVIVSEWCESEWCEWCDRNSVFSVFGLSERPEGEWLGGER